MIKVSLAEALSPDEIDDAAELEISVTANKKNGRVTIRFSLQLDALDMDADHADQIADAIKTKAEEARQKTKANLFIM